MESPASRSEILDIQHALGARVIRYVLRYDQVAAACDPAKATGTTAPSSFTNRCYDFTIPDAVVQGATDRGITVLLTVYGVPGWEFGDKFNYTGGTDAQFAAFSADLADFTQAAATRYDGAHGHPRVGKWTIWNEPNGGYFFEPRFSPTGQLIGPQRYAHMYDAAARRVKAVDPSLLVAPGPTAPMPRDLRPLIWMRAALPVLQELGSPIDAWAHNAYMGTQSALSTTLKDPVVGLGNIDDLIGVLDSFPITRGKPVWITEFGYQTPPAAQSAVSPEQQAALLDDATYFAWRHPRIPLLIWYSLFDDGSPENPTGFQSGLYYSNNRCGVRLCPKPSAWDFQHTLWVSPVSQGKIEVWAQGRVSPADTRVFVRRTGQGWQAFSSPDTATTGTVRLTLHVRDGLEIMTCDTSCGRSRTFAAVSNVTDGGGSPDVSALGGAARKLPPVTLPLAASLQRGIPYGVSCTTCRVTATVLARGTVSGIATARTRSVVVARPKQGGAGGSRHRLTLVFSAGAKRQLLAARSVRLVIRSSVVGSSGGITMWEQPLRLR